jgi:hypothetical protein
VLATCEVVFQQNFVFQFWNAELGFALGVSVRLLLLCCPVCTRLGHLKFKLSCKFLMNKRSGGTRVEQCLNGHRFWFAMGCVEGNKHHGLKSLAFLHFLGLPVGFLLAMDEIRD